MLAKDAGDSEDQGQHGKRDQGQPPVHAQHDDHDEEENEHILKNGEDPGGEHLVQCVYVAGEPGDQAPYRIAVEKAYVHALDVAEDLAAHVEHDFLSGPLHQVGLHKLEQVAEHQRGDIDAGNLRDPHPGIGAEPTGPCRRMERRPRGHVAIDGNFSQVRAEHIESRLEQDGHQRNGRLQLVGPKVGQQPAHQAAVVSLTDDIVVVLLGFPIFLLGLFSHGLPLILRGVTGNAGMSE